MPLRKSTKLIVVHVTATQPKQDIGVKEVDEMHRARGWSSIGYHKVIRRNGKVEDGRPIGEIGAHVAGYNSISVGVAMVGGINAEGGGENNMTKAQWESLERELHELTKRYRLAKICGHRDLSPDLDEDGYIEAHEHIKECPCFDAIPWAKKHALPAADIKGDWDKPETRQEWQTAEYQRLLSRAGYDLGPIDGIIGPKTKEAIKAFQMQTGLKQTGQFNNATIARLERVTGSEAIEAPITTTVDDRGPSRALAGNPIPATIGKTKLPPPVTWDESTPGLELTLWERFKAWFK